MFVVGDFSVINPFSIIEINQRQFEFNIGFNPSLEVRNVHSDKLIKTQEHGGGVHG